MENMKTLPVSEERQSILEQSYAILADFFGEETCGLVFTTHNNDDGSVGVGVFRLGTAEAEMAAMARADETSTLSPYHFRNHAALALSIEEVHALIQQIEQLSQGYSELRALVDRITATSGGAVAVQDAVKDLIGAESRIDLDE